MFSRCTHVQASKEESVRVKAGPRLICGRRHGDRWEELTVTLKEHRELT
jgi:hypothetical protein